MFYTLLFWHNMLLQMSSSLLKCTTNTQAYFDCVVTWLSVQFTSTKSWVKLYSTDKLQPCHPEDTRISRCTISMTTAMLKWCWMPWEVSTLMGFLQILPCSAPPDRSCTATRWRFAHAAPTSGSCSLLTWRRGQIASFSMYEHVRGMERKGSSWMDYAN